MDSSNLAVAASLTITTASANAYSLLLSTLPCRAFCFLVSLAILQTLYRDAHRARRTSQRAHSGVNVGSIHVFHLGLGDFFELFARDLANLGLQWVGRTLVE